MKNYSYSKNKHCQCGKLITNNAKQCIYCMNKRRNRIGKNNPFYGKHHTKETKEKIINSDYHKNRTRRTKQEIAQYKKRYYNKNKIRIKKIHKIYMRNARKNNVNIKIIENLRRRLNIAIRKNYKSEHTFILLGCSIKKLKLYLKKQFKKGMSWKNYGFYGWHIDHIKPCNRFDLTKPKEQQKCFNYKNLRPLWAKENLRRAK